MKTRIMYATSMLWFACAFGVAADHVQAQTPHGAHATRPCTAQLDTTQAWYAQQHAWWVEGEAGSWSDDALRSLLIETAARIERAPAGYSFAVQPGWSRAPFPRPPEAPPLQVANTAGIGSVRAHLLSMAAKREWPTRRMVGAAGAHAAWLIARDDSALAIAALERMKSAGDREVLQADVAALEDIVRQQRGENQLYGSRWHFVYHDQMHGATILPNPPVDMMNLDAHRAKVGLPPMRPALCMALGPAH